MIFPKGYVLSDRYTVVMPLRSDKGELYRVRDADGRQLFLKVFDALSSSQYKTHINIGEFEIEVARRINNPNLFSYIDDGELTYLDHQYKYYLWEFNSMEPLASYMSRVTIPIQEAKDIVAKVLMALSYLHNMPQSVIFNAVSPVNVLVDLENHRNIRLQNLDYACYANQQTPKPDLSKLSPFMMANERYEGVASVQSDLFSVGALLYRLVFGIMPWGVDINGLTENETAQKILAERAKPLAMPNANVPALDNMLISVIEKALRINPDDRFASADEFLDALQGKADIDNYRQDIVRTSDADGHSLIQRPKGNGFADVAGMDDLKDLLTRKILNVLRNKERARKFNVQIPNGMLLYGPPGCGKTFISEKFAEEAGYNFISVKASDLASIYIHGSTEKIGNIFRDAKANAPVIIYFDEFEALVPKRRDDMNASQSGEVNEFLSQMNNCGEQGVFVIASTNRPDLIDPAVLRRGRIDNIIFVPLPDEKAREGLFRIKMKDMPVEPGVDYSRLAHLTEGLVSSDISYIVNEVGEKAFNDNLDYITMNMLESVARNTRPSVSAADVKFYQTVGDSIRSNMRNDNRNPIGFRV